MRTLLYSYEPKNAKSMHSLPIFAKPTANNDSKAHCRILLETKIKINSVKLTEIVKVKEKSDTETWNTIYYGSNKNTLVNVQHKQTEIVLKIDLQNI